MLASGQSLEEVADCASHRRVLGHPEHEGGLWRAALPLLVGRLCGSRGPATWKGTRPGADVLEGDGEREEDEADEQRSREHCVRAGVLVNNEKRSKGDGLDLFLESDIHINLLLNSVLL